MYSDEFIQFISERWNLFEHLHLSEPLFLFFVLKNLYHKIFVDLTEFSIVDEPTFNSFVNQSDTPITFLDNNFLLTQTQKRLLKFLLLFKNSDDQEKGYLESFIIFHSKESEGRSYILVPESKLYYIVNELTLILFNKKSKSDFNKKSALAKCSKYFNLLKDQESSSEISSLIENELSSQVNSRILNVSLCFLLLYFNTSFSGVSKVLIKSLNNKSLTTLFQYTLILNRLIVSHPKEVNLWHVKATLTKLWFSRFDSGINSSCRIQNGSFLIKCKSTNLLYTHLVKIILKLFTDKLLLLDKVFIYEVLSIKPFNNNVICYLRHEYDCVIKYVINLFLSKIKEFNNRDHSNKFQDFTYLSQENKYRIILSNAIFKLFSEFYNKLLSTFSFPGLFVLLFNLIKTRTYCKINSSVINYSDLYTSSFLYTRVDEGIEATLELCDQMIKIDTENCWIENKSKLLVHLIDLSDLKPFYFDNELVDLIFKFKAVYVFNKHVSTWYSFTDSLSNLFNTGIYNDTKCVRMCNTTYMKKNEVMKKEICKIDEFKSESVPIRKFILSDSNNSEDKFGFMDGYGFVSVAYIYIESVHILKRFNDSELDHILNSYSQLLNILLHLFKNMCGLKRRSSLSLNLSNFRLLFDSIGLVYRYSSLVPRLGSNLSVLAAIRLIKRMKRFSRLLFYKYHTIIHVEGDVPYFLDTLFAKLCLLILSQPFRFYIHWRISSQPKIELLYKHVLKLK